MLTPPRNCQSPSSTVMLGRHSVIAQPPPRGVDRCLAPDKSCGSRFWRWIGVRPPSLDAHPCFRFNGLPARRFRAGNGQAGGLRMNGSVTQRQREQFYRSAMIGLRALQAREGGSRRFEAVRAGRRCPLGELPRPLGDRGASGSAHPGCCGDVVPCLLARPHLRASRPGRG